LISAIILSAGEGKRMLSSTPKVLHTISDYSMIYHIVKEISKLTDDIHIVLYHNKDKIKTYLLQYFSNLTFHIQDYGNYPGTAGAIMGVDIKYDKALILNGDMPLIKAYILKSMLVDGDIVLGSMKVENPYGYGRVISNGDNVLKIVEHKDANTSELEIKEVNSGVYLISKNILKEYLNKIDNKNKSSEYYLTDIIALAKDDNKDIKKVLVLEKYFQGVNSKLELAKAEEMMQKEIKNHWMNLGVKMILPNTIYIGIDVSFEGECEIESNVFITGKTKIQNSIIKSGSICEDAEIIDSSIGPMARIRPKSKITKSRIGNFVEIKNSQLNETKAGHLSYIGDTTTSKGVNIGAGTITCNYDGKRKHKTTIGENVFIGSGVELVAPITIQDNVVIGAGSTIRENISSGLLALTKSKLYIIEGYFKKRFNK